MKKSELAAKLIVPPGELENALVNDFNRKVLEDLAEADFTGDVDNAAVEGAENLLRNFLNEVWAEKPQAHKYVINACLALAFLFKKPMHPQDKVGYITRVENGETGYYCFYNEKGTICDYCAADPVSELETMWEEQSGKIREAFGAESALVRKEILACGFQEAGVIPVEDLTFHEEVRKICEGNQCRSYGTSWACPPAVGTVEECRDRVQTFRYLHLFSRIYIIEDFLDIEGMRSSMKDFKNAAWNLDKKLKGQLGRMMILSNESCGRCKDCTFPDEPCRFPDDLHHSIEGYGFYVNELAGQAGIRYTNGPGTVTFFGAVLY